jgi:hypothetical protein
MRPFRKYLAMPNILLLAKVDQTMALNSVQWTSESLLLSILVSISSFIIVAPSINIEAQPESINVRNTVVTAPLTVVVPITVDAQNAQVCVSAASSGDQSCTQVIIGAEQDSYESVTVDLSDPASIPAVTAASPGVSKTITPGSRIPDTASANAPEPPVINIQNTAVTQPLIVTIPIEASTQNAQICVTILSSGSQSCQQVTVDPETGMYAPLSVDLSQPTPTMTQQTTQTPNQPQSINVEHAEITAPITVLVPITADVQNAQICVSAASSGDQSCTQVILNPEQTAYTPNNADLTEPGTPTVSNAATAEPTAPAPTPTATPAPTEEPTTPAPTEEPTTDTGTQPEGGATTEEPTTDTGTQEPSTEGGTTEGGTE